MLKVSKKNSSDVSRINQIMSKLLVFSKRLQFWACRAFSHFTNHLMHFIITDHKWKLLKKILMSWGRFPLGEMSGDSAAEFIWACAFLFVYSLAGEIFLFKIVKMDLTNSRRKNSPQLFDQSKRIYISIFAFSANTRWLAANDQIEGG